MIKKVVLLTEQSQVSFLNKLWLEGNLQPERLPLCSAGFIGCDGYDFPLVAYWNCDSLGGYGWDKFENAKRHAQFITFEKFIELEEVKSMNLDKIETQEEKEALEGIANSSEVPNSSEWNEKGLPPVGVECEVMFILDTTPRWYQCTIDYSCQDVGVLDIEGEKCAFTTNPSNGHSVKFRKPETPEQKAEREREEWAQNVIGEIMDSTGLDFTNDGDIQVVKAMYDLNYRKQNG